MRPLRPKEFIKPTAEALDLPEEMVDAVAGFYWSTVRKVLSELKSPSVTVSNLGTFKARYNQISKLEAKYQRYLDGLVPESMTFNKHTIKNIAVEKLDGLENLRKLMQEEYDRKQKVKQKRKEYVTKKDMGE